MWQPVTRERCTSRAPIRLRRSRRITRSDRDDHRDRFGERVGHRLPHRHRACGERGKPHPHGPDHREARPGLSREHHSHGSLRKCGNRLHGNGALHELRSACDAPGGLHVPIGTITATDSANASVTGSLTVTVHAASAASLILTAPTTAKPGQAFPVSITLTDRFGNVATGYTGTVHFTSSDPLATLPADYTFRSERSPRPIRRTRRSPAPSPSPCMRRARQASSSRPRPPRSQARPFP